MPLALFAALALAPCSAHAEVPGLPLVVGDSVTLAAAPQLAARGLGVNARGCRSIAAGLRLLRAVRPSSAVLALGANGTITTADLRRADALVGRLVLVTPGGKPDGDRRRILMFARSRGLRVVDWARAARTHQHWTQPDGLHLTPSGARAFARMIAAVA